jgi:hypothetical protein
MLTAHIGSHRVDFHWDQFPHRRWSLEVFVRGRWNWGSKSFAHQCVRGLIIGPLCFSLTDTSHLEST